jgi:UDP-glucose:glycoprotein glucosyltransferase
MNFWLLFTPAIAGSSINSWIKINDEWKSQFSLEVVQYVSEHSDVFSFISGVKSKGFFLDETPKELFEFLMNDGFIDRFIPTELKANFELSLANHEYAASVAAFGNYYQNNLQDREIILDPNCSVWVDFGSKISCDTSLQLNEDWIQPELLNIDHRYGEVTRNRTAVFYADIHSNDFMPMLNALIEKFNDDPDFGFVMRWITNPSHQLQEVYLGGYGVELAVKNTEYRAVDDRILETKDALDNTAKKDVRRSLLFNDHIPVIKRLEKEDLKCVLFLTKI